MESGLNGKRVLITGAAGGIGQALCRAFAAEGCRIALHYHTSQAAAEELAASLPVEVVLARADLRSERECEEMFDLVLQELGGLDAIVANAGIWPPEDVPLHEMELARWEECLKVNLTGSFLVCRAFLRHLAAVPREHASIVLIGSTAALFGEAGHADYASAKAAMTYGLTRSLKNEIVRLAPRGRVNAVCPGWTRSPMTEEELDGDPTLFPKVTATMPLKKIAAASDVAAATVFLSSDQLAGHLSGSILPVAGGMEGRVLDGLAP